MDREDVYKRQIEINARERLRDVQFARLAIKADAVPVKDAIRRVRVLLDLKNHEAVALSLIHIF